MKEGEAHVIFGSECWSYVGVMGDYQGEMVNNEDGKVIIDVDENGMGDEVVVTIVIDKACCERGEK